MNVPQPGQKTSLPVVTAFTVPASDTDYVITVSTFTGTDNVNNRPRNQANYTLGDTPIHSYKITMSGTKPKANDADWTTTKPTTYTIPVANRTGSGAYVLYGYVKDRWGNVSAGVSDSITLTIA